ncbi:hypothetical protein KY313_02025 [Candidatus Woesearchaeota archaeon]|jgi:flagellar biogenesis protein FliO|nr:hypothetical protein [Candidatus Woesearchaeota archaeon]
MKKTLVFILVLLEASLVMAYHGTTGGSQASGLTVFFILIGIVAGIGLIIWLLRKVSM